MADLTVITPWRGHPEFCDDYARAVIGARVILIDNASEFDDYRALSRMLHGLSGMGHVLIGNEVNRWFSAACNQGLAYAETRAVLMLNNDVRAEPGFVERVTADVLAQPDALHGPSLMHRFVDGERWPYLEGWCIGATLDVWRTLGGFDAAAYPLPYWEDNDLCLRALVHGYRLVKQDWPVEHLANGTTRTMPESLAGVSANQQTFEERARHARGSLAMADTRG